MRVGTGGAVVSLTFKQRGITFPSMCGRPQPSRRRWSQSVSSHAWKLPWWDILSAIQLRDDSYGWSCLAIAGWDSSGDSAASLSSLWRGTSLRLVRPVAVIVVASVNLIVIQNWVSRAARGWLFNIRWELWKKRIARRRMIMYYHDLSQVSATILNVIISFVCHFKRFTRIRNTNC